MSCDAFHLLSDDEQEIHVKANVHNASIVMEQHGREQAPQLPGADQFVGFYTDLPGNIYAQPGFGPDLEKENLYF